MYNCEVVRIWEQNPETLLAGGLAVLPLAPIAAVSAESLPHVVRRMNDRLTAEAEPARAQELRSAAYILMGLRHSDELIEILKQEVGQMRESITYQKILAEGRAEGERREARRMLLLLGSNRLGEPSLTVKAAVDRIDSLRRLEQMAERLTNVESWDELLAN